MKKSFLLPLLITSLLFTSCSSSPSEPSPVDPGEKTLSSISLDTTNVNKSFTVNDTFSYSGLMVTANYSDSSTSTISSGYIVSSPDMSTTGSKTITVTYNTKSASYTITVNPKSAKTLEDIELGEYQDTFTVGDTFSRPVVIAIYDDGSEENVSLRAVVSGYDMSTPGTQNVTVSFGGKTESYTITVKESSVKTYEIDLGSDLATLSEKDNLNGHSYNRGEYFTFSFSTNGASENPNASKDNGGYVRLLDKAQITISSLKSMSKIEITRKDKINTFTVDVGEIDSTAGVALATWAGESKSVTFTSVGQNRFNNIKITYTNEDKPQPIGDISTIKEVKEFADTIEYLANDVGWYCSSYTVSLDILAIDAIDSSASSSSAGYDPDARGKVLAIDDTGYILLSSSTDTSPSLSFFQKVKKYLKAGTTTYTITGNIAFLNGVVEVKVSSATYKSDLTFTKTIADFVDYTVESSGAFADDTLDNAIPNQKGYGVNKVVKMNGLTYFNVYNKEAGSYLFLDRNGDLIPVFSALNKDRSSLNQGLSYDIIGLESLYNRRPSLRILSVSPSDLEPVDYDFENNSVKIESTDEIFAITSNSSKYAKSEFNLYTADVYVSTFWDGNENRYTFNTRYYSTSGGYTTGTSANDSSDKKSLDVFNCKEIDYNQSLINYVINECKSSEEVSEMKVTLFFTLVRLENVNHREQWRVNVLEDLIFSLDYYEASEASMTFDTSKASCAREDGVYQEWSNSDNSLVVRNESTKEATISRRTDYLKIVDGTKLTITFDKEIIGFTLYKGSYSYVEGIGDLEIEAYKQFGGFFTVKLATPSKTVVIDPLLVGASGNTDYLKVTSITVKYLEA